ncbi:MAG: hydrogenase maturation factor [Blautia sp.]|nr:hydrogenase maturation factor [Blautia sp.]
MRLSQAAMEALQKEIDGKILPGDEVVVLGAVALRGTEVILERQWETLGKTFSKGFLYQTMKISIERAACKSREDAPMSDVWKMAEAAGAHALYAMGEGGVLSALWKMAEASGVGLDVDLRKIPVCQETIEICEALDLHPYRLQSEKAILAAIPSAQGLVQELQRKEIPAAIIGHANRSNDRRLYSGESFRYLERPARDELFRLECESANSGKDLLMSSAAGSEQERI